MEEAMENLKLLDCAKAVELGRADRSILVPQVGNSLSLEEGRDKYMAYVARPPVLGGAGAKTASRYRAVLDKFIPFAHQSGVHSWNSVSKRLLESYGAWLDGEDYAYATEYLELTTLKQMVNWMVDEKLIPTVCAFSLELNKPTGTSTYCYTAAEVSAMIDHCATSSELKWLGDVIVALSHTGLRIGELSGLRWPDVDAQMNTITLTNERCRAKRQDRAAARGTKSGRDRTLPIHPRLQEVLTRTKVNLRKDDRIFHGPSGGILKPDTVRMILKRDVLIPLAKQFPTGERQGLIHGRLHSFRHYFCSTCANAGTPEQVLMDWLGHRDSRMVRHYYHLHEHESRSQMNKIAFVVDRPCATLAPAQSA
jgi:integrase